MALPRLLHASPRLAISTWRLARAIAATGQLGVVPSAPLAPVLARRLELGDLDGELRRAMEHFPYPGVARRVWEQHHRPGGKRADEPFAPTRQPVINNGPALTELTVLANFVEVWLAREDRPGPIGLALHDQAQTALLPSLYGGLLAGADFVLVSGRNPALIPGLLQRLREGRAGELNVNPTEPDLACGFDPRVLGDALIPDLPRPRLLVWVDSPEQAASVCLRASGHIDGFVWDLPPGPRRNQDLERWRSLGVPFWFHGSPATREHFAEARRAGAEGLSLATPFTFCEESPLDEAIKARVLTLATQSPEQLKLGHIPDPSGQTVSVLQWEETAPAPDCLAGRSRLCDIGYFREVYRRPDGTVGYRCPGEPIAHFTAKGGSSAAARGQVCLCNSLLATLGLAQLRDGDELERLIIPAGEDVRELARFLPPGRPRFTAAEVVAYLLA